MPNRLALLHEGVGGLGQAVGEIRPDHRAGHVKEELGQAVGGQVGDAAEDDREGDGGEQGLDQIPQRAEDGLLVDRDEVAAHEEHHQVAVAPQLAQAQIEQVRWGWMTRSQVSGSAGEEDSISIQGYFQLFQI